MTSSPRPCRLCGAPLEAELVDLGVSPLANSYLAADEISSMERFFPLRVMVCGSCLLVQADDYETPEAIFSDYAYFSAYSKTWLEHCARYAEDVIERYGIGVDHRVVEIASNDGSLLKNFVARDVPVLGIEPAHNVAQVAIANGVPTVDKFFDRKLGAELGASRPADLMIGNNVLAHVPDLNSVIAGMKLALASGGVITMEFPHVWNLLTLNQFDTIYHEHFSYLSLTAAARAFDEHGLRVFDVELLPTHGGSLRIHACHGDDSRADGEGLAAVNQLERQGGLDRLETYQSFGRGVVAEKHRILELLLKLKGEGRTIVGYGAPAKGNTLLNYCGIGTDFLDYTTDLNPEKQGHFLPGARIPIVHPDEIARTQPDYVFVLPWNILDEITDQLAFIRDWGGKFIARAPNIRIID